MSFVGFPMAAETAGLQKTKRKGVSDVSDEFSEFSLSSPARKIRRLDLGLPPIVEEEEPLVPLVCDRGQRGSGSQTAVTTNSQPLLPENEEKAIVLYKPVESPASEPVNVSYHVNSTWISEFKKQMLAHVKEESSSTQNTCTAVVPWAPPQLPTGTSDVETETKLINNSLENEEMETEESASMEIDDEDQRTESASAATETGFTEGFQQRQQHLLCVDPPHIPFANSGTPVMWSW